MSTLLEAPAVTASRGSASLHAWVARMRALLLPERVVWCDGSEAQRELLLAEMVDSGTLLPLSEELRPGSFLARSDPDDVARLESRTFICSAREADAGPNNIWREPSLMRAELDERFAGVMRGRTLYVLPFSMGPVGGPLSRVGVQLTDSPYVAVSTAVMTRVSAEVVDLIEAGADWVPAVHSVGMPLVDERGRRIADVPWPCNETKIIAHFPETREIWSYGSGYGGNAILAKKCFALRIASAIGRDEGWLAEHMLLTRITSPEGRSFHVAAAFPSACGKTNFAMMQPSLPGWRVEMLGDDITWLSRGPDGRLWGMNPEAGLFGVAPGTGHSTNPVAMRTIAQRTIFTNVALTPDGDVWWEGIGTPAPEGLIDWRGEPWDPARGAPAAHPNARFTVALEECPSLAEDWDAPRGVPIDAIVLGGRRSDTVPLVTEARDWQHGVFLGATMSSQRTAAAEGTVGEVRFDPFAMQPFCGYDLADHWTEWLRLGERLGARAPRIFRVNWFRRDADGRFLWPGFGENVRVVDWMLRRLGGEVPASESVLGLVPERRDLDLEGRPLPAEDIEARRGVDPDAWWRETQVIEHHLDGYGLRLPAALTEELLRLRCGLWEHIR
ncbi:MAG: phosphoenolpyruvate carboxykinase (GTP) [Micrococcales bacterium]|nr:phosphoenolpyruvate carboxykinase (GTP) [Micrococcales bacterium]